MLNLNKQLVYEVNSSGNTPLQVAIKEDNILIVKILCENKSDIE